MRKKIAKINAITNAQLMLKLTEGVYTAFELAEETGLGIRTIRPYLTAMHKVGVIHITEWTEDAIGHRSMKVYKLGPGKDVPKPRMTNAETRRRYRNKQKQIKLMRDLDAIKTIQPAASTRRINKTLAANEGRIERRA